MLQMIKPQEEFLAREVTYPDIAEDVKNYVIKSRSQYCGCNSLWASEAAHDCMRYLVYQQCNWDEGKQSPDELQLVFQEGENQEVQIIKDLINAGVEVKDKQIGIKIKSANISGKLDCIAICKNNQGQESFLPVEIKSMSDIVYNSVNTVADFLKYPWTRKYYGQIQCYLKNDSWYYPEGYFLAKNKSSGAIKLIKDFDGETTIKFNETYWDELVARGREVKKYVNTIKYLRDSIEDIKASTMSEEDKQTEVEALEAQIKYPERIKYDIKVCKGCKYENICITDIKGSIGNTIDNAGILEAVNDYVTAETEREKYKKADKAFEKAKAVLKELFPLEDKMYFSEKYLIQTKIKKMKDKEYLSFDIESIQ